MKKNKIFLCSILFFLISFSIFSQEENSPETSSRPFDFFACIDAGLYLNPEQAELNSAPSPINFEITFGALIPNYTLFAFQPSLTFFMMNHLLYEDRALPAEIENRTSTTLSFYLNLPLAFSLELPKSEFHATAGIGTMIRFAFLASGVRADDEGFSGSAKEDIKIINKWFWSKLHWLYATVEADWLYEVTPALSAGPFVSIKLPVGSLIADSSFQGSIFSLGLKASF